VFDRSGARRPGIGVRVEVEVEVEVEVVSAVAVGVGVDRLIHSSPSDRQRMLSPALRGSVALLFAAAACNGQIAPLVSEVPDAGAIYGLLVLSQTSLPDLTGNPVCANDPNLLFNVESFGGIFGTSPATDNAACPDGSTCCFSAVDFAYTLGGEAVVDGPITLATSTVGEDMRETVGGAVLLPSDGGYPPPGASLETEAGAQVAFPRQGNLFLTTQVSIFDSTGTQPWASGSFTFPGPPWSAQICGDYAAPIPLRRMAWTHSWDNGARDFDRVLLSMRYEDLDGTDAGYVLCSAAAVSGTLTVPDTVMKALPPGGRVNPVLIGERQVFVPLHGGGVVRLVLQNAVRLSVSDLPLEE
jgi:hypothetical protein